MVKLFHSLTKPNQILTVDQFHRVTRCTSRCSSSSSRVTSWRIVSGRSARGKGCSSRWSSTVSQSHPSSLIDVFAFFFYFFFNPGSGLRYTPVPRRHRRGRRWQPEWTLASTTSRWYEWRWREGGRDGCVVVWMTCVPLEPKYGISKCFIHKTWGSVHTPLPTQKTPIPPSPTHAINKQ